MSETIATAEPGSSRIVERLAELVGGSAGASKVFGDAVERDGVTIVPVGRASWGFGGGAGKDQGTGATGSGGGGGAIVRPLGFIEIRDGGARFRRIVDPVIVAAVLLGVMVLGLVVLRRRRGGRGRARCAARRDRADGAGVETAGAETER
jgi:uncharacterized spore protein YtfJ